MRYFSARMRSAYPVPVGAAGSAAPSAKRSKFILLLNLATVGLIVAWLALACYSLAYLVSH